MENFSSCIRAMYDAQIWGFRYFEALEIVQRLFVKNLLFLPRSVPIYMIYLELDIDLLFHFTTELQ